MISKYGYIIEEDDDISNRTKSSAVEVELQQVCAIGRAKQYTLHLY